MAVLYLIYMPKAIDPYHKLTTLPAQLDRSRPLHNFVPLAILIVVVFFCFSVCNDAQSQIEIIDKNMKEEAKFCLV